jgi:hypothetical protein
MKPFNPLLSTVDVKTAWAEKPKEGRVRPESFTWAQGCSFVPVSFVAKDWNVTPRRIRALLSAGRLGGRLQDNGYWEVCYPYLYTFGTRGPSLKRQQRPPKRSKKEEKKGELYAV